MRAWLRRSNWLGWSASRLSGRLLDRPLGWCDLLGFVQMREAPNAHFSDALSLRRPWRRIRWSGSACKRTAMTHELFFPARLCADLRDLLYRWAGGLEPIS